MSVHALADLSPDEASRALAAAVLSTMPSPGTGGDDLKYKDRIKSIIDEIRLRPSFSGVKRESDVISLVQSELAKEISQVLMSEDRRTSALGRAGRAGRLNASAYEIDFDASFDQNFRSLGVRRHQAERAILTANAVQHLDTKTGDGHGSLVSLFLKRFPPKNLLGEHYLLVQALRNGASLDIDAAWWIHTSDLGQPESDQPLDFLRLFLNNFGNRVRIEDEVGTLLLNVPLPGQFDEFPTADVAHPNGRSAEGISFCGTVWDQDSKTAYVHVAYSVNLAKYKTHLKSLGAL